MALLEMPQAFPQIAAESADAAIVAVLTPDDQSNAGVSIQVQRKGDQRWIGPAQGSAQHR